MKTPDLTDPRIRRRWIAVLAAVAAVLVLAGVGVYGLITGPPTPAGTDSGSTGPGPVATTPTVPAPTSLTRQGLRHTGATWLADAGIPLHVLQGILGHKSIETTRGYLHPDTRHLTDAAARANAFLDGQENPTREAPTETRRAAAPGR